MYLRPAAAAHDSMSTDAPGQCRSLSSSNAMTPTNFKTSLLLVVFRYLGRWGSYSEAFLPTSCGFPLRIRCFEILQWGKDTILYFRRV